MADLFRAPGEATKTGGEKIMASRTAAFFGTCASPILCSSRDYGSRGNYNELKHSQRFLAWKAAGYHKNAAMKE